MGGALKRNNLNKSEEKKKQWTILCVGESGNISSIKLSKKFLIIMGILLGTSLLVSIASIITYTTVKVENIRLRSSLTTVNKKLNNATKEKENLRAQLLIVQEKLHPAEEDSKSPQKSSKKEKKSAPTQQVKTAPQTTSPSVEEDFSTDVLVTSLKLRRDTGNNRVSYEFLLKNKQPPKKTASGYAFIILKPDKDDPASWRQSPETVLQKKKPKNFKRGQFFSIARFKTVRGHIKDIESIKHWEEAIVLVYSTAGELIHEKVFDSPKEESMPGTSEQTPETEQPNTSPSTQTSQPDETDETLD